MGWQDRFWDGRGGAWLIRAGFALVVAAELAVLVAVIVVS